MTQDLYTVGVITGAIILGITAASACMFGVIVALRARRRPNRRKPWSAQRRFRLRRTFTSLLALYVIACVWNYGNQPLPPMMDIGKASVATDANRHPLPCIRSYEGTYSDHSGRHVGAYQWLRSTWESVGNARQDRLYDRMHEPRYWGLQDEKAWRLIELRRAKGLDPLGKWGNAVRRHCR